MPQLIFILSAIFALAGLYNMYLFGQIKERVKFSISISLAMIFWNYTGTISRGSSDGYVFTNKLNPFINKKVPLDEIRSVTLSRANKNLLLMVYLKTANSQDNMSFAFAKEKELVKMLKNQKVNVIN